MTTQRQNPPGQPAAEPTSRTAKLAQARAAREADALRANLRRRKAQALARKTQEPRKASE